ncbi:TetR/AcrR family transcriptional regulator [Streptococcus cristatus]|uniref:TetR/AcrR family transcriptional regulator n=1 Tax=Streptococcus cristatus TaxID=45634 RepID=UPI002283CDF7|nr:TetR/AcrR family transcriptional regulator [Streptococcus cristatus]MCY7217589.1 TetR/AcrR family transcriptional regulator [Streptococcus cristatus]
MAQKRQTSTKEDIKEALIQLLSEEKFENISVSKLCKRAGINRGTFYLHYIDKYDMMERLKEEIISQLRSLFEEHAKSPRELMMANFQNLKENERLINAVAKSKYINFRETIREFMTSIILSEQQTASSEAFLRENFRVPEKYALEIFLSSIEGIVSLWITSGAQESPQEITDIILNTYDYSQWY